jgi:hypothetical protein
MGERRRQLDRQKGRLISRPFLYRTFLDTLFFSAMKAPR